MIPDADRSRVLQGFGYTPRQAHFLVLVALHGGYFLRRHYVAFTGRAHGQAAVRFIANATARGHLQARPHGRQGQVFHLCARSLYAAIGQEHNRSRRPAEWAAVTRNLMTLDFVLTRAQAQVWATEEDKVAHLKELGICQDAWPAKHYVSCRQTGPITTPHFVDKMPWFRQPDDPRLWFAYVDAERTLSGFETFIGQYRNLLAALLSGVAYVGSGTWPGAVEQVFRRAMHRQIDCGTFSEEVFVDYCRLRREIEAGRFQNVSVADIHRFREMRPQFANGLFDNLYARWLRDGDCALTNARLAASHQRNSCALRVHNLPFAYGRACRAVSRPASTVR